jgi:hypothetical protein
MSTKPTSIRIQPALRDAIREYAASRGVTFSAALSVLISEALLSAGFHPDQKSSG